MDGLRRCALVVAAPVLLVAGPVSGSGAEETGPPDLVGRWTRPFEEGGAATPRCVPTEDGAPGSLVCKPTAQASVVLPDGRTLYWNGLEGQENAGGPGVASSGPAARNSRARVLDLRSHAPEWAVPTPERGAHSSPELPPGAGHDDGDMFGADVTTLADGRILIAGGTAWYDEPRLAAQADGEPAGAGIADAAGLRSASTFDSDTDTFRPVGPMRFGRWNPGMVVQEDGRVLVTSGASFVTRRHQAGQVRRAELFDPVTNRWTEQYTGAASETSLPLQPRLFLAPSGKTFYSGVGQWGPVGQPADQALMMFQQLWDPATRTWEVAGTGPLGGRSGTQVVAELMAPPYHELRLVTFGGTLGPPPGNGVANAFTTVTTVDAGDTVTSRMAGDMHHARWFPSGVLLPDGKILAVGGADTDEALHPGAGTPVKVPELYDPASGTWTEMAPHARDRTYLNSAVLLPDMRVLLGGHAPLAANDARDPSFEVWSPPYLFRGERPRITRAPAGVDYGSFFAVATPQAADIESVVLLRTPSAQHVNDSDGRGLKLEFTRTGPSTLLVTAPPSGKVAPPGFYYLVVNKKTLRGPVPSVARMVNVGSSTAAEAAQPVRHDAPAPTEGSATPDEDTSPVEGVASLSSRSWLRR